MAAAAERAVFAVERNHEAGNESVAVAAAHSASANGSRAEKHGGFAEAAAAPVDDQVFARHFSGRNVRWGCEWYVFWCLLVKLENDRFGRFAVRVRGLRLG